MRWGIKYKMFLDELGDPPWGDIIESGASDSESEAESAPADQDGAQGSAQPVDALAAYADQSFHLYSYSCTMPSLYEVVAFSRECAPTLSHDLRDRSRASPLDNHRITRLTNTLFRFDPCKPCNDALDKAVLINTTKREFVRALDDEGRWVLEMAIPLLTVWDCVGGYGQEAKREGEWAGDRLAIVSGEELEGLMEGEDGWTEKKRRWEDVFINNDDNASCHRVVRFLIGRMHNGCGAFSASCRASTGKDRRRQGTCSPVGSQWLGATRSPSLASKCKKSSHHAETPTHTECRTNKRMRSGNGHSCLIQGTGEQRCLHHHPRASHIALLHHKCVQRRRNPVYRGRNQAAQASVTQRNYNHDAAPGCGHVSRQPVPNTPFSLPESLSRLLASSGMLLLLILTLVSG
ncbi:hypothetical protein BDN71DRAFT_301235 [Pleurotus eryngii]|uniref:Uncharacterized protein n=1 Tax=Pleurotus eryngii TaxID=5323 RepID=A0A9P6DBF4_PLEER|nr:hypothetical protein BDN71DRAFT_301235 [Pleurotus eryngii]